jgi:enoyl-CoA hydratase
MKAFLGLLDDLVSALFDYPGPLVALVNGHAIAGGCVLALTADWRVAPQGSTARIGLNEVALGLRYPPRVLSLVKARVPPRWRENIVLGAGLFDVESAQRFGLIDEVAKDAEAAAIQRLELLAAHPRDAYSVAKRALRSGLLVPPADELFAFERDDLPTWTSPELKARIAGVLKR